MKMTKKTQKSEYQEEMKEPKANDAINDQNDSGMEEAKGMQDETGTEKEEAKAADEATDGAGEKVKASDTNSEAAEAADEIDDNGSASESEKAESSDDASADEDAGGKREQDLEAKMAELQDRYLRLTAEYDNYRKRTLKEKLDLMNTSREELFLQILPVVDDFERAMNSVETAQDMNAVKEGMKLIYGKFKNFLNQQGIKEIDAKNKPFDTDLHEAVTKIPVQEKKKKGKVVDVIEKGYLLKEKVIRFSKVVIGE